MTVIHVQSIKDAIARGALIELSTDYRTSTAVRSILPVDTPCAISPAAFGQQIHPGSVNDRRTGLEAICALLRNTLGLRRGRLPPTDGWQFPNSSPNDPFKLEWYPPDRYWVILLRHEQLQPVGQAK